MGPGYVGNVGRNVSQQIPWCRPGRCRIGAVGIKFSDYNYVPLMLASIGLGVSYGIYAAFGLIAFWVVRRFVTETKGRTLEDISMD